MTPFLSGLWGSLFGGMAVESIMPERGVSTRDSITPRTAGAAVEPPRSPSSQSARAIGGTGRGVDFGAAPTAGSVPSFAYSPFPINSPAYGGIPFRPAPAPVESTNKSEGTIPSLYGTGSPFAILADVASRFFPGEEGAPQTTYVPVTGSSAAGGSAAIVFVLLAAGGFAYYYFVYRKRNA